MKPKRQVSRLQIHGPESVQPERKDSVRQTFCETTPMRNRIRWQFLLVLVVGALVVVVGRWGFDQAAKSRHVATWEMSTAQAKQLETAGISPLDPIAVLLSIKANKIVPYGEGQDGLTRQDAITQDLMGYLKHHMQKETGREPTQEQVWQQAVNTVRSLLCGINDPKTGVSGKLPAGTFSPGLEREAFKFQTNNEYKTYRGKNGSFVVFLVWSEWQEDFHIGEPDNKLAETEF